MTFPAGTVFGGSVQGFHLSASVTPPRADSDPMLLERHDAYGF